MSLHITSVSNLVFTTFRLFSAVSNIPIYSHYNVITLELVPTMHQYHYLPFLRAVDMCGVDLQLIRDHDNDVHIKAAMTTSNHNVQNVHGTDDGRFLPRNS